MFLEQGLLGLRKMETEPTDCNQMRQEIQRAAYDSPLINRVFQQAQYAGLSGEDKYTVLAYHALKELQRHYQLNLEWLNLTPSPIKIVKVGEG